jgi:hypothetical protein
LPKSKVRASKDSRPTPVKRKVKGDCLIPPRVPNEVLNHFAFRRNDEEAKHIADYVEWQSRKDKEQVTFLEKVQTEYVLGQKHDCWNVHTNKTQWWVITGPTNLYSQALFPSLDYTLSFHVGLMMRVNSERMGTEDPRMGDRLALAFRRWEQAAEALDRSQESEEIQAVGMRCRETLLGFVRDTAVDGMIQPGTDRPQSGNFIAWSELITDSIAPGSRNEHIRGYLKAVAKQTWQMVNWLTHTANAAKYEGVMAVDATHAVLEAFGTALIRHERETPDRCERCGSMKLIVLYKPERDRDGAVCESCGWEKLPGDEEVQKRV